MDTVRIMVSRHASFYSPLLVAIAGPFLKQQNIQAEYSISTPQLSVPKALRGGLVELGQLTVSSSWADMEQDWPNDLWHFAQINCRDGFFLVSRNEHSDFRWHDLKGKQILVDHLGQPLAMFKYACHKQEIDYTDVEVINCGEPHEMIAAFKAGTGDYIHLQGPFAQQLEFEKIGHVVAALGESIGPVAFSSLVTTKDWLETDLSRRFTGAYALAREYARNQSAEEIADIIADYFEDVGKDALVQSIRDYHRLGCWNGDLAISEMDYQGSLQVFLHSEVISRNHPYRCVVALPPS